MKYILDRTYAKELLEWAYEQNPALGLNIHYMLLMQLKT